MKYTFVANWKMNMLIDQALAFCIDNKQALETISHEYNIILCPSFISLPHIANALKNSKTKIGAQDCSAHTHGAYTGEISAQSLAQVGVTYCIIGHSERRTYWGETDEIIAAKAKQLYTSQIMPIICIGETLQKYKNKQTIETLKKQLMPIISLIQTQAVSELTIAYEPVWAIGTGVTPAPDNLEKIFDWLYHHITTSISYSLSVQLLYGGSVVRTTASEFKKIKKINGFLIGGASTNFKSFASIITEP